MGYDYKGTQDDMLDDILYEALFQYSYERSPDVQTIVSGGQRYDLRADEGYSKRELFLGQCCRLIMMNGLCFFKA